LKSKIAVHSSGLVRPGPAFEQIFDVLSQNYPTETHQKHEFGVAAVANSA